MARLRAGVIGVTGYTGAELLRLLHGHPLLEVTWVAARESAGRPLSQALPGTLGVAGLGDLLVSRFEEAARAGLAERLDVVFTALPHGASAPVVAALHGAGLRVVDLSADFRLRDASVYRSWYGEHPAPELLAAAVYGLPELHRQELVGARLIAAPGCYPTAALLSLAPLLEQRLIEATGIVIDAKSGISGAGRAPGPAYHFPEAAEGLRAYKVAGAHRHTPEIEQELTRVAGEEVRVTFTPHLVPMSRGIFSVAYARPRPGTTAAVCRAAARARYARGLVTVLEEGQLPDTLWVRGTSRALVAYVLDERTGTLLALSAIDNLARGASGQALQALNVALGEREGLGLPELPLFP